MTFKERLEALRASIKAHITPESSKEEIEKYDGMNKELDEIEKSYHEIEQENAKFKDKIINMVMTEGNDKAPSDPSGEARPMTAEELVKEFEAKQDNK